MWQDNINDHLCDKTTSASRTLSFTARRSTHAHKWARDINDHSCDKTTSTHSFTCVTWFVRHEKHSLCHMRDMALTHSYVWHDSFKAQGTTHMCDMKTQIMPSMFIHVYVYTYIYPKASSLSVINTQRPPLQLRDVRSSNDRSHLQKSPIKETIFLPKSLLCILASQRPPLQLRACMTRIHNRLFGKNIVSFIGLFCKWDLSFEDL